MSDHLHFGAMPGGENRDGNDHARLRHARERNLGFPVGRFQQPAPMLFTRDGHNVFLGDMYRGHAAFLIAAGPSLNAHDLSLLDQRGIVTLAVNNAATVYRPRLWTCVDDPGNFCDAIWYDPGILKFVPLCHMEKHFTVRDEHDRMVQSTDRVGDVPCVFGYRRNESFVADQWLYEDTFNWGNHSNRVDAHGNKGSRSVMYVALRLLFYLGIRRVYLLGCDFRMEHGKQNYAFEQDRTRASVRSNNSSYRILNTRLSQLQPCFEREEYKIFNCTPNSGLTVFPHVPFEEAIAQSTAIIPQRIITAGLYDRKQRAKDTRPRDRNRVERAQPLPKPSDPTTEKLAPAFVPELTLVTQVDEDCVETLKRTWPTWMAFRPELLKMPAIVIHDTRTEPSQFDLEFLSGHPHVRFVSFPCDRSRHGRDRWSARFLTFRRRRSPRTGTSDLNRRQSPQGLDRGVSPTGLLRTQPIAVQPTLARHGATPSRRRLSSVSMTGRTTYPDCVSFRDSIFRLSQRIREYVTPRSAVGVSSETRTGHAGLLNSLRMSCRVPPMIRTCITVPLDGANTPCGGA